MKTRQVVTDELKQARKELATCSGPVKHYWQKKLRDAEQRLKEMRRYDGNPLSMRTPWKSMPAGKSRYFEEL